MTSAGRGTTPARSQQAELSERLRALLADEASTREQPMFGGRSFMVNDMLVVSALKGGDLLVRVDRDRHDELCRLPGASTAEMGRDRSMGPGWVEVSAGSLTSDDQLSFWLGIAMDHNHAAGQRRD